MSVLTLFCFGPIPPAICINVSKLSVSQAKGASKGLAGKGEGIEKPAEDRAEFEGS